MALSPSTRLSPSKPSSLPFTTSTISAALSNRRSPSRSSSLGPFARSYTKPTSPLINSSTSGKPPLTFDKSSHRLSPAGSKHFTAQAAAMPSIVNGNFPPFNQESNGLAETSTMPNSYEFDTSTSYDARKASKTYGRIPPATESFEQQEKRALAILASRKSPIEQYQYLSVLRNTNVHLFYRLLANNVKELTPLIYTPTVGEACQRWSELYTQSEGMYLSFEDRGRLREVIQNWPHDVDITVVTDGSRILGLGDLGINGMGIPVGKLSLYTACAGIHPLKTLPLCLDLGTSNESLRNDPLYLGSRRDKVTPEEEKDFLDEMMAALTERWPSIVIQYEDFKNPFPSLERYQNAYAMFNDDIQGTGAVILGGFINAVRQSGVAPKDTRAVFLGAGSAGVGVAKQLTEFFMNEGLSEDEARKRFWLVDSQGLVTLDRPGKLAEHKTYFARDDNAGMQLRTLEEVVEHVQPNVLMGLSTIGGAFTPAILRRMAEFNARPVIFPLSNPSSKSECTFAEALEHTNGACLFASGSPFPTEVSPSGQELVPGQGNNMYVFPGIGLAAILSKAEHVTQSMIYASGEALATSLTPAELAQNWLYPDIRRIREVSVVVTRGVIRAAQAAGVDREPALRGLSDAEMDAFIRESMYDPFNALAKSSAAAKKGAAQSAGRNGLGGAGHEVVANRPGSGHGRSANVIAARI